MKQSPLQRKTPLKASKGLTRSVLVRRSPLRAKLSTGSATKRTRSTGPSRGVVDLVLERAGGRCELGFEPLRGFRGVHYDVHHRRPRRMGGSRQPDTNSPSNLVVLCRRCHEVVETCRGDAYFDGWLLASRDDPARIAVRLGGERFAWLTADGGYLFEPPEATS